VNGETVVTNPYIYDHETADRVLCFMQQQANALLNAQGAINNGVQLAPLQLVAIRSDLNYNGTKVWARPRSAPGRQQRVTMREYVASVYTYNAGNFLADARNGYGPDLALTPPDRPPTARSCRLSTPSMPRARPWPPPRCARRRRRLRHDVGSGDRPLDERGLQGAARAWSVATTTARSPACGRTAHTA
jgi:hypothetical protein